MELELSCFLAGFAGGGIAAILVSLLFVRPSKCDNFMISNKVDGLVRDMQTAKIQLAALNAEVYKPFDLDND